MTYYLKDRTGAETLGNARVTFNPFRTSRTDQQAHVLIEFKSPGDMVTFFKSPEAWSNAGSRDRNEHATRRLRSQMGSGSQSSWYGNVSLDQSLDMMVTGDKAIAQEAVTLARQIKGAVMSTQPRRVPSVVGSAFCVPDVIIGSPTAMRRRVQVKAPTAPLNLCINTTSSGGVSAAPLRKRGIACAALAQAMAAKRQVNLSQIITARPNVSTTKGNQALTVFVKCGFPTTPLDIARAAHFFSSQGIVRGIGYTIAEMVAAHYIADSRGCECYRMDHTPHLEWGFGDFRYACDTRDDADKAQEMGIARDLEGMNKAQRRGDSFYIPAIYLTGKDSKLCQSDPVAWVNDKLSRTGCK